MKVSAKPFDYDEYSSVKSLLRGHIQKDFFEAIEHIKKCDHLIIKCSRELTSTDALVGAIHAHSLYLAAVDLAISGHFSAMFPLLRTALESAIYGYLFNKEEGLAKKWRNRNDSQEDFNISKKEFTPAIKRFRKYLQEHDASTNGTHYEEAIMSLYDAAIDFGAHPNPIALLNNTTIVEVSHGKKFSYKYIRNDEKGILQGLLACFDFGIVLAEINHLSSMISNISLPGLDETFLPFIRETNDLADKLNGEPIGFESRYYNQINTFVPR